MRKPSPRLDISGSEKEILETLSKSHTASHREVVRAKALLLAGQGIANTAIGLQLGISPSTVVSWRSRFAKDGLVHFAVVRPGRGRKASIPEEKIEAIVEATMHAKPPGETTGAAARWPKHAGSPLRQYSESGRQGNYSPSG